MAALAEPLQVQLVSGFSAVGHPAIATGEKSQAFTYSVTGGSILTMENGDKVRVSIDCAGIDAEGGDQNTEGHGHCVWRDADDDKLFVALKTQASGNRYSVSGGTGKWSGASGSIDTVFTYLPAPAADIYLGVEEGKGTINKVNKP